MAKSRKRKKKKPLPKPLPRPAETLTRRLTRILKAHWRLFAQGAGLLATFLTIYYEYRWTIPEILPDPSISQSSNELPLTARNQSTFFDLKDAKFVCDFENVTWKEPVVPPQWFRLQGHATAPVKQRPVIIPSGGAVTFPCEYTTAFKVALKWGRTREDLEKNPITFPMGLEIVQVQVKVIYYISVFGIPFHREALSEVFTWRRVADNGGFQWLEGDTFVQ